VPERSASASTGRRRTALVTNLVRDSRSVQSVHIDGRRSLKNLQHRPKVRLWDSAVTWSHGRRLSRKLTRNAGTQAWTGVAARRPRRLRSLRLVRWRRRVAQRGPCPVPVTTHEPQAEPRWPGPVVTVTVAAGTMPLTGPGRSSASDSRNSTSHWIARALNPPLSLRLAVTVTGRPERDHETRIRILLLIATIMMIIIIVRRRSGPGPFKFQRFKFGPGRELL
jgi:hypothetical protein